MGFLPQPVSLQSIFGTKRTIDTIMVQCIISEDTNDTLTITKQPIQVGASITDHAFKEPTVLNMVILQQAASGISAGISQLTQTFTGGGLSQIYQQFLTLQEDRTPFVVTTPKRVYKNMLISVLRLNTDKRTENILSLSISFQQIFLVTIGASTVTPTSRLANPKVNAATQNNGQKQSAAYQGFNALIKPRGSP